jgi:hypothetical protein
MPLSDYEQHVLAEIERGLITDDPKFAASIGRSRSGITRAAWAIGPPLGLCLAFACFALGVISGGGVGVTLAVISFVLIVASCWAAVRAPRIRRSSRPHGSGV